jgi:DNA-directed RNA polymerase specialized sigma24 family protein
MEDRLLVEALRSRDPIAMGAVYDDYAERLYGYCWFQLRNGDAAQVAFRDTLMCAEAHIAKLRSPARFGAWLYALARIECRRRRPAGPVQPDLPIARHDQDDVDLRLMAWRAVDGLPPLSRELLDLRHRHHHDDGDLALITGLRPREIGELLAQARVLLEAALTAEILAHDGLDGCAGRAAMPAARTGAIDDDLRETLVRHSLECPRCARHLPDNIAPGKVYDLLPRAPLPPSLRGHIMNCFTDPELAGYRLFAAARVSRFGAHGFPQQPGTGRAALLRQAAQDAAEGGPGGWARALTAVAGALIAAMSAITVCGHLGREVARVPGGIIAAPPGAHAPRPSPAPPGRPPGRPATRPVAETLPLAPSESWVPAVLTGPSKALLWAPQIRPLDLGPTYLTLPAGGTGTITLGCPSTPVPWRASGGAPLGISPAQGLLLPGATQHVTVRAPAHGSGSAVVTFWPGGEQVTVAWTAPRRVPPPSTPHPPHPTSSPPSSPSQPTPTPDPTTPPSGDPAPSEPAPTESAPAKPAPPAPTQAPAPPRPTPEPAPTTPTTPPSEPPASGPAGQ